MDDKAERITELINSDQLTAPDMTHALKNLGEGSMQNGLKNMAAYYKEEAEIQYNEGRKDGIRQSIPLCLAAITSVELLKFGFRKYKAWKRKKAEHAKKGEKILNEMEAAAQKGERCNITPEPDGT